MAGVRLGGGDGELYTCVLSTNLTHEGVSIEVYIKANSWRQRWNKDEAISLFTEYLRRGEWTPMLTMWLGDGKARWRNILQSKYELLVATKEPWRLDTRKGTYEALVATGREAFERLRKAAGVYGELLDLLRAHKWVIVKLAADDGFRAAYKQKKRRIEIFRETYGHYNGETPIEQFSEVGMQRRDAIVIADIVMYLHLVSGNGGTLFARRYVRDVGKALAIAERLESAGLRHNVVRAGSYYMVYIATADLLKLAERDETIRKAIALYLAEKAKNGTPRQREIAEKILKRNPLF